ncbi:MAG TPA: thioesterase domain-containing protein [Phycisphaerae bacterium]|nr:thioesterase domain-containing protein [Phycisphaerae bacterium]HRR84205.1 thioesterase domain-containing protein [Phycisphaerae bacterium]
MSQKRIQIAAHKPSPWILRPRPVVSPRLRLFCFAHAGGGASLFRNWPCGLSDKVEVCAVQSPGREERLDDCPYARFDALEQTTADQIKPWLDVPFALFGHELGALVAFELVRRLRRTGLPAPVRLIVAGCAAPHLPRSRPPIHRLSDDEFLDGLAGGLAAVPDAVRRRPDLVARILPGLRADFTMLETYTYRPEHRLDCPITALGGSADPTMPTDALAAWAEHTSTFSQQMIQGDQFFLFTGETEVLSCLANLLSPDYL